MNVSGRWYRTCLVPLVSCRPVPVTYYRLSGNIDRLAVEGQLQINIGIIVSLLATHLVYIVRL